VASRARAGALSPDELRDGTFTISNPGQYGTLMATPVINQPQVAILDVEAIVRRPVVVGEQIAIRPICILGLSWDHRALDGVYAARFLAALRERLENV
jgi:pyruvate/2-oxoglutarate dehydrogenase complex dihydrolipoamide acyltransferase (E2) component